MAVAKVFDTRSLKFSGYDVLALVNSCALTVQGALNT